MEHEQSGLLVPTLIILAAAIAVVPLVRRARISPVIGYLFAGVLIGPHGLRLIDDVEAVSTLAEFGVVFLLFAIGLELSIDRVMAMRRHVFGLGALQVVLTGAVIWGALRAGGLGSAPAFVLGSGLALSSTAVVLRLLQERGEAHTRIGRVALAVLLFQDLAVVPLLTVIPLLGQEGASLARSLGVAGLKAVAALVAIILVGRLVLNRVLRHVAAARTPELFTAIALFLALGVSWVTGLAGLSMALGAFLAGLLISETEYRHQVEGDIEPFRGLLLALFFMTIGMEIDVRDLAAEPLLVGGGVLGLVMLKTGILVLLGSVFRLGIASSAHLGLMLAQAGEFGLVLFTLAMTSGALDAETARTALLVVALSLALTPLLMRAGMRLGARLRRADDPLGELEQETRDVQKHVLILGMGRAGGAVARLLDADGVEFLGLDVDPDTVADAREQGMSAFFGDGRQPEVLRAAGLERASAVVVTLDAAESAERAVHAVRTIDEDVPVIVRARHTGLCGTLTEAGATSVVPELAEGSLQIGGRVLEHLGRPPDAVDAALRELRDRDYAMLGAPRGTGSGRA